MAFSSQQGTLGRVNPGDVLLVVRKSPGETPIREKASGLQARGDDILKGPKLTLKLDDFDARSTDELTLRKGDRIELVELDEGFGDGWYLGRHLGRGGTGLFPGGKAKIPTKYCCPNEKYEVYTTKVPSTFPGFQSPAQFTRTSLPNPPQAMKTPYAPEDSQGYQTRLYIPTSSSYQNYDTTNGSEKQVVDSPSSMGNRTSHADSQRASSMTSLQNPYSPSIQRSIGQTLNDPHGGQDSPVMNETLSVIDEHMQDMNTTPRTSLTPKDQRVVDDSESEYSSHQDRQSSYVAGTETDDEEGGKLTEGEVKSWNPKKTADHLRELGVDPRHCDIFEEQEITGDVLLEMDQAFIYMKEYDFGVMGRRLKTWHKIRDFQEAVRGAKTSRQTTLTSLSWGDLADDMPHQTSRLGSSGNAILPRIPSLAEQPGLSYHPHQQMASSQGSAIPQPLQTQSNAANRTSVHGSTPSSPWRASIAPESPSRPSAALVRDISHSRRHSSIDFAHQTFDNPIGSAGKVVISHKPNPSLDREWSLTSATPATASTTAQSLILNNVKQVGYESSVDNSLHTDPSSVDLLDRGYFSGNELDSRKAKNVLRKRDSGQGSPMHSRQSSMLDDSRKAIAAIKRHSRLSSVDSIRDLNPKITSPAAKAYHSKTFKGRMRSASERTSSPLPYSSGTSPTVTNLEVGYSPVSPLPTAQGSSDTRSPILPLTNISNNMVVPNKARRIMGLRTISDAVTGSEKSSAVTPVSGGALSQSPVDSPTGSNTPSVTSRSFEIENTDPSSKSTEAFGSTILPKVSNRARPKTKKETSAYTRGLHHISPEEARKTCDHSGWMKKKSSSLLTTWKPRLFILRGRRLSYYYSETDTVERGIIDISGHKVLVANSDPMMTLHATITGASSSAAPSSTATSSEPSPVITRSPSSSGGPFYFKLVPPKAGISRAVQFTKPTIHYFQVDTLAQGRKWMGEMMKATIEHDLASYETTNKQKTISLAKARERRERPPALKETAEVVKPVDQDEKSIDQGGLKIQGLDSEKGERPGGLTALIEEKVNGEKADSLGLVDTGQQIEA